jgi:glutaredoxin-like YruB-family protein
MKVTEINSFKALMDSIEGHEKAWLLLYKKENNPSMCALENLTSAASDLENMTVLSADVAQVRDIHGEYGVSSVPSLIQFEKGKYKNVIKGCHPAEYYQNLLKEASFYTHQSQEGEAPAKRVTVYSTPTCSWCTTLKNHLRNHKVKYTEIDVSKDQAAAQAMVAKSGQQGVPQTDINGEMIIGFDKNRINTLLNIKG